MIKLFKNKIIYENIYSPGQEEYVKKEIDNVIPYLTEVIEIDDKFTLEDFFKIIEKDIELYEVVFSSHLGHHSLKPFIDDIHKEVGIKEDDMEVEYLECKWYAELANWGDGKEFEINVDFHGWGSWYDEYLKKREIGGIAIEYSPLSELKKLQLKLNENFILYDGKTYKTIRKGKRKFTVYDVFGAILDELSFAGEPEDRDETFKEVKDTVSEAKERIKKEGKDCYPSFDELIKEKK